MVPPEVLIRPATPADAAGLAQVHVQAWAETYRGVMPGAALETAPTIERRTEMWTRVLRRGADIVHLAETDGAVAGFSWAGAAQGDRLGTTAEIIAINLLDRLKRRGVGRALLARSFAELRARGHGSVGLWCVVGNTPAERFYEKLGGRRGPFQDLPHGPVTVREVGFLWAPIPEL